MNSKKVLPLLGKVDLEVIAKNEPQYQMQFSVINRTLVILDQQEGTTNPGPGGPRIIMNEGASISDVVSCHNQDTSYT